MGKFISQKVGHEGWSRAGMDWAKQKSEDEENRGNMVEPGEREREREERIGNENGKIEKRGIKMEKKKKKKRRRWTSGRIRGEKLKQETEGVIQRRERNQKGRK